MHGSGVVKSHTCFMHVSCMVYLSHTFYIFMRVPCMFHAWNTLSCMFHEWKMHGSSFHAWNMHESIFRAWNILKHAWKTHENCFHAWNELKYACFGCSILSRGPLCFKLFGKAHKHPKTVFLLATPINHTPLCFCMYVNKYMHA